VADATVMLPAASAFTPHWARGRFNAAFFRLMGPYLEWNLRSHKEAAFGSLPDHVVEVGAGVGANLRYLPGRATLVAVEPNPHMHRRLQAAADRRGVRLELLDRVAEHTALPDDSVDVVISSLVLCSVSDPSAVLAEIRRILRPGGSYRFVEHVVAPGRTPTRALQRALRRPWAWTFEGCSCERDLEHLIRGAGFARVAIERYRLHTPFVPFNTHIAGRADA
jgi:ubiquinone/menaquinone biosynthesis C-methylase UbiE